MSEHPIQGLMRTAMENLKQMVDVNTIVGDPVTTPDGTLILPISKVGFGFAAGGSEFTVEHEDDRADVTDRGVTPFESRATSQVGFPFGGGSGGGVSITPIAFLVVGTHGVKVVPLDNSSRLVERIFDSAPGLVEKITSMFGGDKSSPNVTMNEFNDVTIGAPMEPIPKSTIS
ncbi:GerW family sporulation protein [Paenibacillus sp.]|uniref:GerW family sporulation protein n=1 Tax=Paenibacillus sp. TaxID=58172 RepID=UPI002D367325|nr:GerW family sporulation protein [Paenibacillus sp.]HZG85194.1 GerW family sporulation protein [Paenibacillus sp.]